MSLSQIVLVEDEIDIADLLVFFLKFKGYDVTHAANGELAMKHLAGATPDLIVTDIMMPVMDGAKLLASLRQIERLRLIPTLVISALSEEAATHMCKGFDAFLQKPFEVHQLLGAVQSLLDSQPRL